RYSLPYTTHFRTRMLLKNWLPKPSPLLAPFTNPAISTISTVAGRTRSGFTNSSNFNKRLSGTFTTPTFGSMVQKGKLALCAFAFDKQLNRVDFPTFGNPTIPAFIKYFFNNKPSLKIALVFEGANIHLQSKLFTIDLKCFFEKRLGFISLKIYKNLTIIALSLHLKL